MLSGRESSSAFRVERCDSHFTSGQGLDAALPTVSIFEFRTLVDASSETNCENGQVSEALVLLTAPGECHGLTADLENLIRVIKRLARKLADDYPDLTLASCVSLACFSHNNGFKTRGYSPIQWAFGADNEGHGFTTTMPSEIETFRMSAMNRYLQEQAKDAISRAQHTWQGKRQSEPASCTFVGAK